MKKRTNDTYSYPVVEDWSVVELTDVTEFFRNVERAYEQSHGVKREQLVKSFQRFQEINPARTEQNQLRREFERNSGFDVYQVLKQVEANPQAKWIKIN
ncbi:UPF0223 family protein [Fructilactobacillus cliffordii]|uniref:UPF0223 family protein n=1 Tax=Fructilactobacillus cliffordii TaxID=2940299 RepID=A0A9Q8ZQ36_9LACO|nr:UPF0223 family protein [Fructilactobacillus cliffordii]USS86419.1 UPF0223 family protein [Fructilactobacillus cliffordii]USS89484.1 UPF0223 family protein [Fructilactobacillus cliffordii]